MPARSNDASRWGSRVSSRCRASVRPDLPRGGRTGVIGTLPSTRFGPGSPRRRSSLRGFSIIARRSGLIALIGFAGCASGTGPSPDVPGQHLPRGIVLVIGDGMGVAHFTLAQQLRGEDFEIGRLPEAGLVVTASADDRATDSAASATAYATGAKTMNRYLGLDSAGRPQRTVVEAAEQRGMATGLVTTAPLADATPAAFVVHARDRHDRVEVARQFVSGGVDVLVSGGLARLGQNDLPSLEALAAAGKYQPVPSAAALRAADDSPVLAVLPSAPLDGDSPEISLSALAEWALGRLGKDPDGFFLLLEHEGTDTASHANDVPALRASLRSLDETVGVVMEFARKRGDILVVVCGDHETGALQIGGSWDAPEDALRSRDHTGAWIPIFAYGPGAAAFGGLQENTDVGKALLALVGHLQPASRTE